MTQTTSQTSRNTPDWAARKSILIVQTDMDFGLQIARSLCPDGHDVLGPVTTVHGAYRLILGEKPSIGVLDGDMPGEDVSRLSDMLLMMDIPHLVTSRKNNTLTRFSRMDDQTVETRISLHRTLAEEVTHAIWDIHSRSLIFDLLSEPKVRVAV